MKITTLSILTTVLLLSVTWYGCDKKNLDLMPHSATEENYFVIENDFTKAVIGVYAKLSDFYWYHGSPNNGLYTIFYLPGDDITCNDNEEFEQFGPLQPSSPRVNEFYSICYQLAARANVVLEKIEQVKAGIYVTPGLKEYHKGEALFLRGFANYYLWNYFGTASLDTVRVIGTDQFTPSGTSGTQLLDQAIKDFTQAAELLPESWSDANRGRVTRNAANGMLGKCLVFRASVNKNNADYTAAITAFDKISGVSLTAAFNDNFSYQKENNSESLFEFQAGQAFELDNIWLPNDFNNAVGSISAYYGFYDNHPSTYASYSKSRYYATAKLAAAFEPADPRIPFTLDPADRTVKKYVLDNMMVQVGGGSINNTRLLRYADVLLLKAEAIVQSGGATAAAVGLVNEIRTRARNMVPGGAVPANLSTAETNRETIMRWIMDERFRELAGEGQRWPDIRRWHIQGIITLTNAFFNSNSSSMSFQLPKHLLFPIPNSEIDVNPNMVQNTGY